MSYDRYERRREKMERKLARSMEKAQDKVPLDEVLPIEGLSGPELELQLRKRAQRRIQRRSDFYKGLIAYVAVNLLVWAIWVGTWFRAGVPSFPWPLFVTLGWGMGVVGEAYQLYQDSAGMISRRREMELERMRLGLANDAYEKPKRDQAVRLSDDGELIPDDEPSAKPKRDQL